MSPARLFFVLTPAALIGLIATLALSWVGLIVFIAVFGLGCQLTEPRRDRGEGFDDQCPVCGYFCVGRGGIGCIDKPADVERKYKEQLAEKMVVEYRSRNKDRESNDGHC